MHGPFGGEVDSSSFSTPTDAVTEHIDLTWKLNFQDCTICGSCIHRIKFLKIGVSHVSFDCSEALLRSVTVLANGVPTDVIKSCTNNALGYSVSVPILEYTQTGAKVLIQFDYTVTSEASAAQWLEPSGTKGGKYPYLFTQSCAIHARSLFPCMDTPSVKATYTAIVTAPIWCTVLMSALLQGAEPSTTDSDMHVFTWHQPVPVPSYLISLAAGNLESRNISERVRIWAEPEVVESAEYEFAQTEDFLSAAEQITGCPYQWGRYDVLCLPPSFPYGGAEMPCLTFVTPTLLAGDRSLADVIVHEIAHSWTGNLVTNHTWAHFWLNEGWTMWLERKVAARVRGSQAYLLLSAQSGWKRLQDEVTLMGETGEFTSLVWPLADRDPDEAFSSVPYEKGFNLLYYLESVVGTEQFEEFAQAYISRFKLGTITSTEFANFFMRHFACTTTVSATIEASASRAGTADGGVEVLGDAARETLLSLDWEKLLLSPGMPVHPAPDFTNDLSAAAESLAARWIAAAAIADVSKPCNYHDRFAATDIQDWSSLQVTVFLDLLLSHLAAVEKQKQEEEDEDDEKELHGGNITRLPPLPEELLRAMDSLYALTTSRNAEILLRWQCIAVQMECAWVVPSVVDFITSQGRMKYVRPLYRALLRSRWRQLAVDTFRDNQHRYHPIARKMIAVDMRVAEEAAEDSD